MKFYVRAKVAQVTFIEMDIEIDAPNFGAVEVAVHERLRSEWEEEKRSLGHADTILSISTEPIVGVEITQTANDILSEATQEMLANRLASDAADKIVHPPTFLPKEDVDALRKKWTNFDRLSCLDEGWTIMFDGYACQIQAEAGMGEFSSDEAAERFVKQKAQDGSVYHRDALELAGLS